MAHVQLNEPTPPAASGLRPFALGFRPFFLLAGFGAMGLMLLWILLWHQGMAPETHYGRFGWHSHEMLFGYTVAVIAGFLLTAVPNWTGHPTPTGSALAALAGVWLAGRLLPWFPGMPQPLIAATDLIFLPLLAAALVQSVRAGANKVNRLFLPLLGAMTLANALVHAEALGWLAGGAVRGADLMLDLVLLTLIWVGGRIMPFFTERAIPGAKSVTRARVEQAGFALILLLAALDLAGIDGWPTGIAALVLGAVQAVRLIGWHHRGAWGIPILWVLYTGYSWLVLGLVARGLGEWGLFPSTLATHALTTGAIGVFTLGMMSRVALGHTGRAMRSAPAVNSAFVAANLAAAIRVFGPYLLPEWYVSWILLSGLLWLLAFALFAFVYTPILLRPRIDGREG